MSRRGFFASVVVCCVVTPVLAASSSAGAGIRQARAATPYDGLIFRARGVPTMRTSAGWNDSVVCSNGVRNGLTERHVSTITPTTIAPAANGAMALSAIVTITYDGDRVVGIQGAATVLVGGVDQQLDFIVPESTFKPQCSGFPSVATSAAGQVYAFNWNDQVCDNGACTVTHSSSNSTGCFATDEQAAELVATMEFGPCTPAAFPVIPPPATVVAKPGLLNGLLLRVTARTGAYTFRNDCGSQLFLNGYSTWTQVLRPVSGLVVSGGSQLGIVPLIFAANGNAKDWAGQLDLGLAKSPAADAVKQTFKLTDYPQAKTAAGWGCRAKSGREQSLNSPLPVYVWGGKNGGTYVGRAWIRVLGKDGQTADSHTGGAWSALIAFGAKNFSGG